MSKDKSNRGKLISFEGIEGCGKTTQAKALFEYLKHNLSLSSLKRDDVNNIIYTKEPGGTRLADKIKDMLLFPNMDEEIEPYTEFFLFMASRVQHTKQVIIPALASNLWVICDRFIDSTVVYQGIAKDINLNLIELSQKVAVDVIPDITFLLDIEPSEAYTRVLLRNKDMPKSKISKFDKESIEFYRIIRKGFLDIAKNNEKRVKVIHANHHSIDEVQEIIRGYIRYLW